MNTIAFNNYRYKLTMNTIKFNIFKFIYIKKNLIELNYTFIDL